MSNILSFICSLSNFSYGLNRAFSFVMPFVVEYSFSFWIWKNLVLIPQNRLSFTLIGISKSKVPLWILRFYFIFWSFPNFPNMCSWLCFLVFHFSLDMNFPHPCVQDLIDFVCFFLDPPMLSAFLFTVLLLNFLSCSIPKYLSHI